MGDALSVGGAREDWAGVGTERGSQELLTGALDAPLSLCHVLCNPIKASHSCSPEITCAGVRLSTSRLILSIADTLKPGPPSHGLLVGMSFFILRT